MKKICSFLVSRIWTERLPIFCKSLYNHLAIELTCLLIASCLVSCRVVEVYKEPDRPFFQSGERVPPEAGKAGLLRVVTFNIRKAMKIRLAASELKQFSGTETADIYLLQEMDEKGVREIANSLSLNYVYIPVVQKTSSKKDIGNAILSKGPIACFEKLLLPHAKPLSNSRRLVTIAEVTIHREKILVYSVQTETVVMSNKKRMEQVDAIIAHARMRLPGYKYVLIGGDFNTLFTRSSRLAVAKFRESGFEWSTETVSTTARAFFGVIKPKHDYIFSKGLKFINASKMETSKSSDHYPVLATFSMKS